MRIPVIDKDNRITILSLSWRDIKSKGAGGAEIHTHILMSHANPEKYRIYHISMAGGDKSEEVIDGVTYYRMGGLLGVIHYARQFYRKNRASIDYVIDQCNTHRFFSRLWVEADKRIFYIHQLTREIWDINAGWPLNFIGKHLETTFLRMQRFDNVITVSNSTKNDLLKLGFDDKKIYVAPNYITTESWEKEDFLEKDGCKFVYCGRYAKYKGIDVSIEAIGLLKKEYPYARLVIVGKKDEEYVENVLRKICAKYSLTISDSDSSADVYITGFVSDEDKIRIMSESKCLLFPSIREGWGLIITEAAVVGTPSIVYNSPGAIDAVNQGEAGYICEENTAEGLATKMKKAIDNEEEYNNIRNRAYEFSKEYLKWGKRTDVIDCVIQGIETRRGGADN